MRFLAASFVVCTLALAGFAAQAPPRATATIAGEVVDDSGSPVAGATVRLTGTGFKPRTAVTDARGQFRFNDIPPSTYEIEVNLAGFVPLKQLMVVRAGAAERIVLRLRAPEVSRSLPKARAADSAAAARVPEPLGTPPPPPAAAAEPRGVGGSSRKHHWHVPVMPPNTEAYDRIEDNDFRSTSEHPLSTFSIDVDTAAYANVRRFLNDGAMPPADAVRIEEMINYFRFDYPQPANGAPFSVTTEVAAAPWNPKHRLALIGLQARALDTDRTQRRNLVFLIDVSGSMQPENKLPLIRKSMRMLVDTLTAQDRIAIVVYAGASGLVLPPTRGSHKERIHHAIASLDAGGSTNGGAGIILAYQIAEEQFIRGGINRVILATDGDFNVGITDQRDLVRLIEQKRQAGVFLSVLGVGTGNLKDSTMEKLADKGNGNYSYLDSLHEARKVLVAEAGGTLVTVAKDVKIQVEFNPAHVGAYRLIGYENRLLRNEDFNNDRKDAGDIGAGHTVTALYEIVPADLARTAVDPLRYQAPAGRGAAPSSTAHSNELMTVKLRYKEPDGQTSRLLTFPVLNRTGERTDNLGFACAVAEFGMLLRNSEHKGSASYREAATLARRHRGSDESGYRSEFIRLVELAEVLSKQGGEWHGRGHGR